jgi:catecholate siderophore receptor
LRTHQHARPASAFLALSCVGLIAAPASAQAQETPPEKGQELEGVTVTDTAVTEDVKVGKLESPKYTRQLLDIPQTVTVIGNTTIRQQNLLTLRDALATIPGISFGAGEGGGGYGDSINLRGQSANTDIQIDGVRDSAQYSRSDTFNLEQIEVVNGANSVYGGGGSIAGTINLVTKRPKGEDLTVVQGAIGSDSYYRGTIDSNVKVSEHIAVRLNAMWHENDIPRRDVEYMHRWGVAPSVIFGLDTPTRMTLLYTHQQDRNIPVYGVPYYKNGVNDGALPGVPYGGYYGYKNVDRQRQTVDQATAIFDHDFTDKISIRNLARYQRVKADTITDAPQGVYCLAGGVTPTGVACVAPTNTPGVFYPSGPRGTTRFQTNRILYDQLDLRGVFTTLGLEHSANLGVSIGQEDYTINSGAVLRNANGTTPALDPISIYNPNPIYTGPYNYIASNRSTGDTFNKAAYFFDAIKLGKGFELNGGVRYESSRNIFRADPISTVTATLGQITIGQNQRTKDNLFSYRVGLVFKPIETASLYVAYGNSKTPVSSSVRTGCGLPISTATAGVVSDPCNAAPQTAVNYEIGGKIDLMDAKLQLTASVYRNDRTNFPVASNDPALGTVQVNDGRSRVDGLTLGASGRITPAWTIFANYTYLKAKIRQGLSNFCIAHPGASYTPVGGTAAVACANSTALVDPQRGDVLQQTPKNSGSLFTTYTLPFQLQLGYGLTYQGSFAINQRSLTSRIQYRSNDYLIHRLFVSYPVLEGLTAQLNVQNLANKKYYTGIRNNGWAVPGEGRQVVGSLFYSF